MREFVDDFLKGRGLAPQRVEIQPIRGDGSKRAFGRIIVPERGLSFVTMCNPPRNEYERRENIAYVMIGRHLRQKGLPVPEFYRIDLEHGWFILEDMGERRLQDEILSSTDPVPLYEKVLKELFSLQVHGAAGFDTEWCCQTKKYDRFVMHRLESDYFREAFLFRYMGMKEEWPELAAPFGHLSEEASRAEASFLLHRDFQSRNIMVDGGRMGILDWQGARLGPLAYDLASLLIDPYTDLDPAVRGVLYRSYLHLLADFDSRLVDSFERTFPYLAIQRNLQILGAFGFLTKVRGKGHFEVSIPKALGSLRDLIEASGDGRLSPLGDVVRAIELGE